ncbi:unnamed protein product [Lathyrus sativus]|nr:unnamed protein product [Lathyrus sativus]
MYFKKNQLKSATRLRTVLHDFSSILHTLSITFTFHHNSLRLCSNSPTCERNHDTVTSLQIQRTTFKLNSTSTRHATRESAARLKKQGVDEKELRFSAKRIKRS